MDTTGYREREDLSAVLDVLRPNIKFRSLIRALPGNLNVLAQKHEWLDRTAKADTISLTASGGAADWDSVNDVTDLPCTTANCNKLRPGDVLRLPTGPEVVIVDHIDLAAQTIDLVARGHGATAGTAQGAVAFTAKIIGNTHSETGDAGAVRDMVMTERYNYTQIFSDVVSASKTLRASKNVSLQDELDLAVVQSLKDQLALLNKAMLFGYIDLNTTTKVSTMDGIRNIATSTCAGGTAAVTKVKLEEMVATSTAAGGSGNFAFIAPLNQAARINLLYEANVDLVPDSRAVGLTTEVIKTAVGNVKLFPDTDMLTTEIILIDIDRINYGPLSNGKHSEAFYSEDATTPGSQLVKRVIYGQYTIEVRQPAVHVIGSAFTA